MATGKLMSQAQRMLPLKWTRKAVMAESGVRATEIAAAVPCSIALVNRVISGGNVWETRNSKRIKRLIAERVGIPVEELWPEADSGSEPRAAGTENGDAGGAE